MERRHRRGDHPVLVPARAGSRSSWTSSARRTPGRRSSRPCTSAGRSCRRASGRGCSPTASASARSPSRRRSPTPQRSTAQTDGAVLRRHAQRHLAVARRRGRPRRRQPGVAAGRRPGADGPLRRLAGGLREPPGPWNEPRLLYLQHASDPVVWWYWSILWSRPDWLAEPRGPDVNTALDLVPLRLVLCR